MREAGSLKSEFSAGAAAGHDGVVAKIELPEGWAGVAEPLRARMAEIERESHADGSTPPDLAAVSALRGG